jgi:multiple sugar transport system permease protein
MTITSEAAQTGAVGPTPAPPAPRRRRQGRDWGARAAFLGPALGLLLILVAYPLVNNIAMAFQDVPASLEGGEFVGFQNFIDIAGDQRFWDATLRTIIYSVGSVAVELVLGVLYALLLNQQFRGRGVLRALFLIPMIATPVAIAMVWRLMFQPDLGLFATIGSFFGLPSIPWVSDPVLALPSLMLVDVWQWTPFIALIVLAGLAGLPTETQEAAMVDGANAWQRFWRITLPALRPVIAVAAVTRLIEAMRTFDPIYVITGGGPGQATETLNLYAYNLAFQFLDPSYAAAVVVLFVLVMLIFSFVIVRLSRRS